MQSAETEQLYKNMIIAQYEYLHHFKDIKLKEIEKQTQGKILNPHHWMYNSIKSLDDKGNKTKDKKKYKKLLLQFHPDKNIDKTDEAKLLYNFVHELIDKNNNAKLQEIQSSENPWNTVKNFCEKGNDFIKKEEFVNDSLQSLWYNWEIYNTHEHIYVTEEELNKINIEEKNYLSKIDEVLRKSDQKNKEIEQLIKNTQDFINETKARVTNK